MDEYDENGGYFMNEEKSLRVYNEIANAFDRMKEREIEEVLTGEDRNLDNITEKIGDLIDAYEDEKKIFYSWVVKGEIPEDFLTDEETEDDE